jgi:hypothetical protein
MIDKKRKKTQQKDEISNFNILCFFSGELEIEVVECFLKFFFSKSRRVLMFCGHNKFKVFLASNSTCFFAFVERKIQMNHEMRLNFFYLK